MREIIAVMALLSTAGCAKESKPVPDDGNIVQILSDEGGKAAMDRRIATATSGTLVHVISLYEASTGHMSAGDATISIDDQGGRKLSLVLSSYEAVDWHIEGPGAAAVSKVYLNGHKRHSVDGVAPGRVVNVSGPPAQTVSFKDEADEEDLGFGHQEPKHRRVSCALTFEAPDGGGCEAGKALVAQAMPRLGGSFATYTGIYNASRFRIERWPGT